MRNRFITGGLTLLAGVGIFAGSVAIAGDAGALSSPVPAVEFGRVRIASGPSLHYAVQGPEDGPAFILIHGYSDSWYSFSPVLPLLPTSWRVYALTQRGHGDSERPAGDYSPPRLARDVVEFMDALGIERATIVGHSLGSIVAQHLVVRAPERVERIVLIGAMGSAGAMPGMDEFQAIVNGLTDPVPVQFAHEFQASTIFVPLREVFMDSVVAESARLPAHVWKSVMDGMVATGPAPDLESIDVPALVIWGDRDTYAPLEEQGVLVERLRARLIVYPQIGHAVHWEAPEWTAHDLIDFVSRT